MDRSEHLSAGRLDSRQLRLILWLVVPSDEGNISEIPIVCKIIKSHYIHRLLVEQKEHILGESAIVPNIFVGLVLLPEHNSRVAGMPHKYLSPPETRMIFARSFS